MKKFVKYFGYSIGIIAIITGFVLIILPFILQNDMNVKFEFWIIAICIISGIISILGGAFIYGLMGWISELETRLNEVEGVMTEITL